MAVNIGTAEKDKHFKRLTTRGPKPAFLKPTGMRQPLKPMPTTQSEPFYSDGQNHSNAEINSAEYPDHEFCIKCNSDQVTVREDKDICHSCGHVNT